MEVSPGGSGPASADGGEWFTAADVGRTHYDSYGTHGGRDEDVKRGMERWEDHLADFHVHPQTMEQMSAIRRAQQKEPLKPITNANLLPENHRTQSKMAMTHMQEFLTRNTKQDFPRPAWRAPAAADETRPMWKQLDDWHKERGTPATARSRTPQSGRATPHRVATALKSPRTPKTTGHVNPGKRTHTRSPRRGTSPARRRASPSPTQARMRSPWGHRSDGYPQAPPHGALMVDAAQQTTHPPQDVQQPSASPSQPRVSFSMHTAQAQGVPSTARALDLEDAAQAQRQGSAVGPRPSLLGPGGTLSGRVVRGGAASGQEHIPRDAAPDSADAGPPRGVLTAPPSRSGDLNQPQAYTHRPYEGAAHPGGAAAAGEPAAAPQAQAQTPQPMRRMSSTAAALFDPSKMKIAGSRGGTTASATTASNASDTNTSIAQHLDALDVSSIATPGRARGDDRRGPQQSAPTHHQAQTPSATSGRPALPRAASTMEDLPAPQSQPYSQPDGRSSSHDRSAYPPPSSAHRTPTPSPSQPYTQGGAFPSSQVSQMHSAAPASTTADASSVCLAASTPHGSRGTPSTADDALLHMRTPDSAMLAPPQSGASTGQGARAWDATARPLSSLQVSRTQSVAGQPSHGAAATPTPQEPQLQLPHTQTPTTDAAVSVPQASSVCVPSQAQASQVAAADPASPGRALSEEPVAVPASFVFLSEVEPHAGSTPRSTSSRPASVPATHNAAPSQPSVPPTASSSAAPTPSVPPTVSAASSPPPSIVVPQGPQPSVPATQFASVPQTQFASMPLTAQFASIPQTQGASIPPTISASQAPSVPRTQFASVAPTQTASIPATATASMPNAHPPSIPPTVLASVAPTHTMSVASTALSRGPRAAVPQSAPVTVKPYAPSPYRAGGARQPAPSAPVVVRPRGMASPHGAPPRQAGGAPPVPESIPSHVTQLSEPPAPDRSVSPGREGPQGRSGVFRSTDAAGLLIDNRSTQLATRAVSDAHLPAAPQPSRVTEREQSRAFMSAPSAVDSAPRATLGGSAVRVTDAASRGRPQAKTSTRTAASHPSAGTEDLEQLGAYVGQRAGGVQSNTSFGSRGVEGGVSATQPVSLPATQPEEEALGVYVGAARGKQSGHGVPVLGGYVGAARGEPETLGEYVDPKDRPSGAARVSLHGLGAEGIRSYAPSSKTMSPAAHAEDVVPGTVPQRPMHERHSSASVSSRASHVSGSYRLAGKQGRH